MKNKATMLLAGLACLMLSVVANAGPIEYTSYKLKYGTSGAPTGTVTYPADPGTATTPRIYAGELTFNIQGGGTFDGFCIDLSTTLKSSGSYEVESAGGLDLNALGVLFEKFYSDSGMGKANSAAFQLAIWSIIYSESPDVIMSTFDPSVVQKAGDYLTGITGNKAKGLYAFSIYDAEGNQNMLTWKVPEPGTLALLGVGLLGAGMMRRRRAD
nr:PEP-CTERM sorting domain-containing protein [Wenzhouxiangella sp. XN24]